MVSNFTRHGWRRYTLLPHVFSMMATNWLVASRLYKCFSIWIAFLFIFPSTWYSENFQRLPALQAEELVNIVPLTCYPISLLGILVIVYPSGWYMAVVFFFISCFGGLCTMGFSYTKGEDYVGEAEESSRWIRNELTPFFLSQIGQALVESPPTPKRIDGITRTV